MAGAKIMKIKLGKLPDTRTLKVTVSLPVELKTQIERYAQLHSQTWAQEVDAVAIIPHILAQFIANDRAFRNLGRGRSLNSSDPK